MKWPWVSRRRLEESYKAHVHSVLEVCELERKLAQADIRLHQARELLKVQESSLRYWMSFRDKLEKL